MHSIEVHQCQILSKACSWQGRLNLMKIRAFSPQLTVSWNSCRNFNQICFKPQEMPSITSTWSPCQLLKVIAVRWHLLCSCLRWFLPHIGVERQTSLAVGCFHSSLTSGIFDFESAHSQGKGFGSRPYFVHFRWISSSTCCSSWYQIDMQEAHILSLRSRFHRLYRWRSLKLSWRAIDILAVYSLSTQAIFLWAVCTSQVFSSALSLLYHIAAFSLICYRGLSYRGCFN